MKKNQYEIGGLTKTTGFLGQCIPVIFRNVIPNDEFIVQPSLYLKLAALAYPVSGTFQLRLRYFFVPMRLLWSGFVEWFLNKTGTAEVEPYKAITSPTKYDTSLFYYVPWQNRNISSGGQNINMLPIRAYRRAVAEHVYKFYTTTYAETTLFNLSGGSDTTTITDIMYDTYDPDLYTRLKTAQEYGTAPNIAATPFTWNDVRNLQAITKHQENMFDKLLSNLDAITKMFETDKPMVDRSELIASFVSYLSMNEVISQSATTDAPLGASVTTAYSDRPLKPFTFKSTEFGIFLGILSVVPDSSIVEGADKDFLHKTSYTEYFNPAFVNLGNVPATLKEVYLDGSGNDDNVIGYRPIYQEYRERKNMIAGQYADDADEFIIRRTPVGYTPSGLGMVGATEYDYLFSVPAEPHIRIFMNHDITAMRSIPKTLDTENNNIDKLLNE